MSFNDLGASDLYRIKLYHESLEWCYPRRNEKRKSHYLVKAALQTICIYTRFSYARVRQIDCVMSESHEREYRRIWFLFVFAQMTYVAAWSSILCYVTSGMIRSADEMPIPVWVSTVGLLSLYQTFVSAQAKSIYVRCHACVRESATEELWRGKAFKSLNEYSPTATAVYQLLDSGNWQNLILVAMNISSNLISGVLYSIPAIREILQIPNGYNGNETWCILTFIYSSSVLLLLAAGVRDVLCGQCTLVPAMQFVLGLGFYITWSVGCFFFWGYFVMRPLLKYDVWIYIAVIGSGLFTIVWIGVLLHKRQCALQDKRYLWEGETIFSSRGFWLYALGSTVWFLGWGHFTLRHWLDHDMWPLAAFVEAIAFTLVWVYYTRQSYPRLSYTPILQRTSKRPTEAAEMISFGNEHFAAALAHLVVLLAVIIVTTFESVDINSHYKAYSFWLDRKKAKLQNVDRDLPVVLDYCVRPNSLPVMKWWCVLAWSLASCCYHATSAIRLKKASSIQSMLTTIHDWGNVLGLVSILGVSVLISFVAMSDGDHNESWTKWVVMCVLCGIGVPIFFVLRGISDITLGQHTSNTHILQQIANDKWIEYSISATTMHVIVNCVAGIVSAHELVLLCGYLTVSMILIQLMEASMVRMEQAESVAAISATDRIECERSFVALSFFSKLTLTVALCAPIAISDAMSKGSFLLNTEPILCT
jgi:hypothetical protein